MSSISAPETDTKSNGSAFHTPRDWIVYLLVALGCYLMWILSETGKFLPSTDMGYWTGVLGVALMSLLFLYPLRKHLKFVRNWGRLKSWFVIHMLLGVAGPLLILLHSNFRIGSLNAGVALYSMLVVMLSGIVGRFLFVRVNQGLVAQKHILERLGSTVGISQMEVHRHLESFPQVLATLDQFEKLALIPGQTTVFHHLVRLIQLPISSLKVKWECSSTISVELASRAKKHQWSERDRKYLLRKAMRRVNSHLKVLSKVGLLITYKRLLSTWHVAHIPFVYLLVLSAFVHVIAVHAY
ncbi:hypothetical protein [Rhodoferax mekongensis]|uniref:hypothetical protein n=1 Tax=Rhodoferax mekongensis TaxID=3068341 RepID=UPI0028BD2973|nr:hypothetical protein [Rhodoferax sp. TBRC 17199]MDT7517057.1 hypothetical protein [Rhodoferax sp. TBRC 17199]